MSTENQKEYLHQEVDQAKQETSLENIYDQLAMLSDIDESEAERGDVLNYEEVVNRSNAWLK